MLLTPRWTPLIAHPEQIRLINSPAKVKVVPAGRRSGKTERAKREGVKFAMRGGDYFPTQVGFAAPTRPQAKRIYWDDLKALVPPRFIDGKPSETELMIRLINGSQIWVLGLDAPARIEGTPWDWFCVDEIGNSKPDIFQLHIHPALGDRDGVCWLIGVPEGMNHYYELAMKAKSTPGWDFFHWISADIMPAERIEAYRKSMDELTFRQEFEADFVTFQGLIYYPFADENVKQCRHLYDASAPLIFMFDFNVSPGVAAIGQEHDGCTNLFGQVWIPHDSNTPRVCRKLIQDWGTHQGEVHLYGDPSGGNGGTAKVAGSDWDLIKAELRPVYGARMKLYVPPGNPRVRTRINAVNSRICSADGTRRLFVDPSCDKIIRDFRGVRVLQGSAGEIDKKADDTLTHISDAIGYYIEKRFPFVTQKSKRMDLML